MSDVPSLTPIVEELIRGWRAAPPVTVITAARIYQAWPQTQTKFPILVLWDGKELPAEVDQGGVAGIWYTPPVEIAGYDPNQMRELAAAVRNATPSGLTVSGFADVIVRLGPWVPRFDAERKLFQKVATIRIYAKPA